MADIRGFRGFRYDLGSVGTLSDVVAPPYDVIDPALQQKLYDSSPYNAIRLELTRDEPGDDEQTNKYTRAGNTLREWVVENAVRQDTARGLYVYEQEYTVEGQTFVRRGFLARVRLEPFGSGKIYPHEQTMSGPKEDRLKLYRATGFNLSPIFGLYPDDGTVFAPLEQLIRSAPPIVARDHLGVINRLWVVTDSATISKVIGAMGPKPVYIADGHHRYETGLKYLEERRAAGEVADDEAAPNFCLMMLVGMSDPGLLILPTHRLVSGLAADLSAPQLEGVLAEHFDVLERTGTNAQAAWEHVLMDGSQSTFAFGTVADGLWTVAKLRDRDVMASLAPDQSEDWRELGVSILHKLVLDRLLRDKIGGTPVCKYVHLLSEVTDATAKKECQLACLVPPVGMGHVEQISEHGEKMPPKSTYFYPKLLTGLVFNSLKKD
ncbi:hypothetical protein VT84_08335 [Gemmata sp. SH-PL17]|uniref:DUF1015 domain-containing protein n=1 Tax=Gemmata sp. SH-PL17 TaxID=1630693 RepID=UPI00078D2AD9|nr:DUF1015 domain-containing protein [Gemmata sp. SH-PL17]AMV24390.1 hypothetical protein VT84_08335 [Gemmata sp. SH-PL17]